MILQRFFHYSGSKISMISLAFVLIPLLSFSASAQNSRAGELSRDQAALMQLERDIGQANIKRDKAFFERVEADEFVFTDSGGGITTKAEDVASLDKPPGEFRLVGYDVDQMKASVYGKTAVVTGRITSTYRGGGRESVIRTRFTDTFVKRGGRWQIVAGHSSRIREPQK
jgi:hypothetical protein